MADDLMRRIRLGEDSVLEFKSVRTERGRILAPDRHDLALDPRDYWCKVGAFSPLDMERLLDPVDRLWINGYRTFNGANDKIPEELMKGASSSLRLIGVDALELRVFAPGEAFGNSKRRVRARFDHGGSDYALWVTDPVYERTYLMRLDGSYELGGCFLTVSLGEPYEGACHKLVAAIIRPESGQ